MAIDQTSVFVKRNSCPGCDGEAFNSLLQVPFSHSELKIYIREFYPLIGNDASILENGIYELVACPNCSLIFQLFVLNDHYIKKLYSNWIAPEISPSVDFTNQDLTKEYFSDFLLLTNKYFGQKEIAIYDFGMGWSKWLSVGALFATKMAGFDLDETRCAYAAAKGFTVLSPDQIENESFDIINVRAVFEHLIHPREIFDLLSKKLRPGGILKFSVPYSETAHKNIVKLGKSFSASDLKKINEIAPLEHVNSFSHKSIIMMGAKSGLTPVYFSVSDFYRAGIYMSGPTLRKFKHLLLPFIKQRQQRSTSTVFLEKLATS